MPAPLDLIREFGRIDAESESLLGEFFIKTDAYARVEDQKHIIVIGRKGTGKTAIYEVLTGASARSREPFRDGPEVPRLPVGHS